MNKLIGIIVAFLMVGGFVVQMSQNTCPEGNGWVKVESSEFTPVEGACAYCFKAGSDNSQGCEGGIYDSWPLPEGACGLSHWSYKLCDPTATPTIVENTPTSTNTQEEVFTPTENIPTETFTPTEDFTQTPSVTPSDTPCPTPSDISPTPSDTPRPTFTPGPSPTSSGNGLG